MGKLLLEGEMKKVIQFSFLIKNWNQLNKNVFSAGGTWNFKEIYFSFIKDLYYILGENINRT
jgi:hypothetical protein